MDEIIIRPINLHSDDLSSVITLLSRTVSKDPSYIPTVASGAETPQDWYAKKHTMLANGAYAGEKLVGHIALREYQAYGKRYEICRLFVDPAWQHNGIASELIRESFKSFTSECWASSVKDSSAHKLFLRLGWRELGPIVFVDDDAPGVVLTPN